MNFTYFQVVQKVIDIKFINITLLEKKCVGKQIILGVKRRLYNIIQKIKVIELFLKKRIKHGQLLFCA